MEQRIAYAVLRPRPPKHPVPFTSPVLVFGSAPSSHVPEGYDGSFPLITVNGSQSIAAGLGLPDPDVTFMTFNQIEGTNPNAVWVRSVLSGRRTGLLHILRWSRSDEDLHEGLARFNYGYDTLRKVSRYERIALFEAGVGRLNLETDQDAKFSNGLTAVLYAFHSGAPAVIISGVNPGAEGHAYNDLNLSRRHSGTDRDTLLALKAKGLRLFTADPSVAENLGLPLWRADSRETLTGSSAKQATE